MKKIIALFSIGLCLNVLSYGQTPKLSKKDATKILEKAWDAVKNNDSTDFIKLWAVDQTQWPYHAGQMFKVKDIKTNFLDFRNYFDSALVKKLKFSDVEVDTVEHNDPHYDYGKYYIKATFKYSAKHISGFGFYMDYINKQWYIRFSPDYFDFAKK